MKINFPSAHHFFLISFIIINTTIFYCSPLIASTDPKHLVDLRTLLQNTAIEDSSYTHKSPIVKWKEENAASKYECHADCSGLVTALLQHSYGLQASDFKLWMNRNRPKASHYYEAIKTKKNFKRILSLDKARPGDFIVIKYPALVKDTGHIMILNARPQEKQVLPPLNDGIKQWILSVIDCSTVGHGLKDSRYTGSATYRPGIGCGSIRIFTNSNNHVIGYSWSSLKYSKIYENKTRPLAIGRILIKQGI